MIDKDKNKITSLLVLILFVVAPFVMSFEDIDIAILTNARLMPAFVSTASSAIRWGVIIALVVSSLYNFNLKKIKFSAPVIFISLFYALQLSYAVVDGVDYMRFFLLSTLSLLLPPIIGFAFKKESNLLKYFAYSIAFFLLLSLAMNGHMVVSGQRFFGFMNNANIFGLSLVFWLAITIMAYTFKKISKQFYIALLVLLVLSSLLSGSRNSMVGVSLLLFIHYYKDLKGFSASIILLIVAFYTLSYFIDLDFVTSRFLSISESFEDSGRTSIWKRANKAIDINFWWGNGMDANYRIADTGNMHNCYVRFLLNMGIVFTVASMLLYTTSIFKAWSKTKALSGVLAGYLLVFALMNVGEDFFVGIGSSSFIYLMFIYGLINYIITAKNDTTRKSLHKTNKKGILDT